MLRAYNNYFFGNECSNYAKQNKRVDYHTFSKAFNHVLANDIIKETSNAGFYWESENESYCEDNDGNIYTESKAADRIQELNENIEALEAAQAEADDETGERIQSEIDEINENIEALEEVRYKDIFQFYIVDDNGAEILRDAGETLFYCETLDLYVWGVDHWGTSWDYVLTDIEISYEH